MCPLWMTIGKAALSETRVMWYADDAYAAQEERRSYFRRANRGGVVNSGIVAGGVASYLDRVPLAMDTPGYRAPQFEQLVMTVLY